jgi:arsenite-transporting ATPase
MNEPMPTFLCATGPQLILFGGKGGVGKTTCAAAAGLWLAQQESDHAILLLSSDPAHSLRDCLPGPLPNNLHLRQIDADGALVAFKKENEGVLREIALRGTMLDASEVNPLLDLSLPGLDELMAFLEIGNEVASGKWARIVIDTAPMGHTLRLLGLFEVIGNWFRALDSLLAKHRYMVERYRGQYTPDHVDRFLVRMESSLSRLTDLLCDGSRCCFVPILLPEQLSLFQTEKLVKELSRLGVTSTSPIVNCTIREATDCLSCRAEYARQQKILSVLPTKLPQQQIYTLPRLPRLDSNDALLTLWPLARPLELGSPQVTDCCLPIRVSQPLPMPSEGTRLLIVGGKGGVGKTTVACATALALNTARPNLRILLYSTDPAHSLAGCFGFPIGSEPVEIRPNLNAVEIDAEGELARLKDRYQDEIESLFEGLSGRAGVGLEFDREAMASLMDLTPPGIDEVMALTHMVELLQKEEYQLFVLDTAPSGHLIRLLGLPRLAEEWLKMIFSLLLKYREVFRMPRTTELLVKLSKGLKYLQSLLSDQEKGKLLAVGQPGALSLERTRELLDVCGASGIRVTGLILNQVTPESECCLCMPRRMQESSVIETFAQWFAPIPRATIDRAQEPCGVDLLAQLGEKLYVEQ